MEYTHNHLEELPLDPVLELDGPEEGAKFCISAHDIVYNVRPNLCDFCAQLTAYRLMTEEFILHQVSFRALGLSVDSGCHMCTIFRAAVLQEYRVRPRSSGWSQSRTVEYQLWRDKQDRPDKRGFYVQYLQNKYSRDSAHLGLIYKRHRLQYRGGRHTYLDEDTRNEAVDDEELSPVLFLSSCDPYISKVNGRPITRFPNFDLCRSWLRTCSLRHPHCGKVRETDLPKRVIDIGRDDTQQPRLIESLGRNGIYVTLSHCWGSSRPLVTDTKNYLSHLKGIPLTSFPPLFQDAIIATRRLRLQYLWIDSLCIIQDNTEDWEAQCACMHIIYQNSALTLAAPAAVNSEFRFLEERNQAHCLPCMLPEDSNNELPANVMLSLNPNQRIINLFRGPQKEVRSPLAERAWVLQERLLAPRVLYLGSAQMYFECNSELWYESAWERCGPVADSVETRYKNVGEDIMRKADFEAMENFHRKWFLIVRNYTDCKLTASSDRLPALSGIARKFKEHHHDDYLAGLWRKDLVNWLQWETLRPSARRNPNMFIPSWSWAKLDGERVRVGQPHGDKVDALVLHAETTPIGQDAFGDVKAGTLLLHGRIRYFTGKTENRRTYQVRTLEPTYYPSAHAVSSSDSLSWHLDIAPLEVAENGRIISGIPCLLLGWKISEVHATVTVLTLEAVDGMPNTFRRIGIASGSEQEWQGQEAPLKSFEAVFPQWAAIKKQRVTLI